MNSYSQFQKLLPTSSIDVVTITVDNGDGTSQAQTLSGATITVKGDSVGVGLKAFIRGGEIVRQAPDHSIVQVSI